MYKSRFNHHSETKEDMTQPIYVSSIGDTDSNAVHENCDAWNRFVLSEREIHGRRTKVRVTFEVYSRAKSGDLSFQRLRGQHMLINLPSSEQAELAIDAVKAVCRAMDGKHLVRGE